MGFKYAELFAGILGFGTALDDLGGDPVFISEIDKHAQQAIRALGRGDLLHGDITKIDAAAVPDHDLMVGGFPCQAFSVGGKRLGFLDMRGTLFFEAVRIAAARSPKAILLENVKGLLSHAKGETISVMLHALNDIGYLVDFNVLNSKFFGAAQNRERIYIVAVRADVARRERWIGTSGKTIIPKTKRRLQREGIAAFNFPWPQQQQVSAKLSDILEQDVDERFYLQPDRMAALLANVETDGSGLAIREATKKGYAMAGPGDAVNFQFPTSRTRRGRIGKQIANTLEASGINQGVVEQLSLFDDETEQPDLFHEGEAWAVSDVRYRKRKQNGRRIKGNNEPSFAITTEERHGVALNEGGQFRIRKLTPRETWRLQTFPDSAFDRVRATGISETQLYKQAGNAVTVNTVKAVAERLLPYLYKKI